MKKFILGLTLVSTFALAGCQDQTVASSTAGKITQQEFYDEMKTNYGENTLQSMLTYDILEDKFGDRVTQDQVDEIVKADTDTLGGEDQFNSYLEYQGISKEEYTKSATLYLYMTEAAKDYDGFSDDKLKSYYEDYQPAYTVSHILVDDEATANEVLDRLNKGEEWNSLVSEYSKDTASVANNGQLSYTPGSGELDADFDKAASALDEGETSDAVKTSFGYHIIRMDKKPTKGTFEEERDNVEKKYTDDLLSNSDLVSKAVATIVSDANVVIDDDDLQSVLANMLAPITDAENTSDDSSEEQTTSADSSTDEETTSAEASSEETSSTADSSSEK